jgi:putative ABC transport system permease protein
MRFLNLVAKNALRNKRRTLLTILSVAVSLFMFCALSAVRAELDRDNDTDIGHLRLVVRRATSLAETLPESYRQKLQSIPGVVLVHPMSWFGGIYQDQKSAFANVATDARTLLQMFPEYKVEPAEAEVFIRERTAALAGRELAERLGWKLGDRITLFGTIYPVDLEMTIRAIYTGGDEDTLFFHQEYLDEALGGRGTVRTFRLKAASAAAVPRVMTAVDEAFRNTPAETKTETERSFQLGFVAMAGNIKAVIITISSVVVFAVLMVTANTAAMAIRERVREIAVLKTLGFRRRTILALLLGESATIALIGGLLGSVAARLVLARIDTFALSQGFIRKMLVSPETIVWALAVAGGIGLLSAAVPAVRATRITVAEALRHVV